MKSTVIIPNYNGMKFIENCMKALEQETDGMLADILGGIQG